MEYTFCSRSAIGLVGLLGGSTATATAAVLWHQRSGLIFAILTGCFACATLACLSRMIWPITWGSYVDDQQLVWYSTASPEYRHQISLCDVSAVHLDSRSDTTVLVITTHDGNETTIYDTCIGDGRAILESIVRRNPSISILQNGRELARETTSLS